MKMTRTTRQLNPFHTKNITMVRIHVFSNKHPRHAIQFSWAFLDRIASYRIPAVASASRANAAALRFDEQIIGVKK